VSTPHPASPDPADQPQPIDLPLLRKGKVRDVYQLPPAPDGTPRLLMVASDRVSAFDVIMPTPIPGKGRTLTAMAAFWFNFLRQRRLTETHLLSTSLADLPPGLAPPGSPTARWLEGRITIGRACEVIPIECVVRGYLEGSGWKDYQQTGSVCGVALPKGLRQGDKLPQPIFTPATKAATGHDENISFDLAAEQVGLETMGALRELSLAIYQHAADYALARGIIIADTKFEFGVPTDARQRAGRVWTPPILIDEALTPDSSRFWPADLYQPGRAQASYDKQFLREYLETLVATGQWKKTPPGPELPAAVVAGTQQRYAEALRRLTT
jgi:phosphoribosylaminoimidazole-succinocarboxamide synthase